MSVNEIPEAETEWYPYQEEKERTGPASSLRIYGIMGRCSLIECFFHILATFVHGTVRIAKDI
jgi:hypothetical protein